MTEKAWAHQSSKEQKRLFHLLVIWAIFFLLSLIKTGIDLIGDSSSHCLICNLTLILITLLGLICTIRGSSSCSLSMAFTIPLFIYAYFLSDFNTHAPAEETVGHTVFILSAGLFYLLFFSKSGTRIRLYFLAAILTIGFHLVKGGILYESFVQTERLANNPILIFTALFLASYLLRRKFVKEAGLMNKILQKTKQSINKVMQETKTPIALLSAEHDEEGNITELNISKVNNAFESQFKINLYEVQDQKAEYIFNLIFKNRFDVNEMVHFKRKRSKEFHAGNFNKWINVHMLTPEYNKFYLIFEDVTDVKRKMADLEDSRRRYKVLLEAIPDIFFVIDKDGTYEDFVVKESNLFKVEDADIIGSTIYDVGFADNMARKIYSCIQSSIKNNSIESIEYSLNTPNGTFLYEMRLAKLSANSVISIARDITKRKTAEFNLEKALKKAEESDRLKSAFLANLSHEIRTPMNVITNFTRLLAETELESEDKMEITDAISQNGKQLLNMIDNTIHLSKIETEAIKVSKEFCRINDLLRQVYNRFYPHIPDYKDINLNLKLNVNNKEFGFITDYQLLSEALTILVDNAIKYTLQGSITISYEMIKNEEVKFVVSDTGIGIPSEEAENVFNRFYRLNNNINETTSGSGLGLAIAKHYVEMLGGKLEFESQQHVGTKFYFTLPFDEGKGFMMLVS